MPSFSMYQARLDRPVRSAESDRLQAVAEAFWRDRLPLTGWDMYTRYKGWATDRPRPSLRLQTNGSGAPLELANTLNQ